MEENKYIAGTCNIGGVEVTRRKNISYILITFTVAFIFYFILFNKSFLILILLFLSTMATAINYQQVKNSFCVMYGLTHTAVLSDMEIQKVTDTNSIKKDRIKVLKMFSISFFVAFAVSTVLFLLFKR